MRKDTARHEVVEEPPDGGQVLLHGGGRELLLQLLDVGRDEDGLDPLERKTVALAPVGEARDGEAVGPARLLVPDLGREELDEPLPGLRPRSHDDRGQGDGVDGGDVAPSPYGTSARDSDSPILPPSLRPSDPP